MFNEPGDNPVAAPSESLDARVDPLGEAPVASPVDPRAEALVYALRRDLLVAEYSEERLLSLVSESARRACLQGYTAAAAAELNARIEAADSVDPADSVAPAIANPADPAGNANLSVPADPAATIALLFFAGEPVSEARLAAVFSQLGVAGLKTLGLVTETGSGYFRAALSLTPLQMRGKTPGETVNTWFISDLDDHLRQKAARQDHVMGIGGATRALLKQLPRGSFGSTSADNSPSQPEPFTSALDLGTGCGVIAVQLAQFSECVVATDTSDRALKLARLNLRLNAISSVTLLQGSLFQPVAGQRFDLIASNPPFVITPGGSDYEYRSSGFSGDGLVQQLLTGVPEHLRPGGEFVSLINWEVHWGSDRFARPASWVERLAGVHTWLIAREVMAPLDYAMMWARDGGSAQHSSEFDTRVTAALRDFQERKTVAVVMGSVRIIAAETKHSHRAATITGQLAAGDVGDELSRIHRLAVQLENLRLQQFLGHHFITQGSPQEHRRYRPGQESPNKLWLSVASPFAQQFEVDPLVAAAVGASDGDLTLGQIAAALAELFSVPAAECYAALHTEFLELVWAGVLVTEIQQ